jgi:hypothetical protein
VIELLVVEDVEKHVYENLDGKTNTHYPTMVVVDEEHTVEGVDEDMKPANDNHESGDKETESRKDIFPGHNAADAGKTRLDGKVVGTRSDPPVVVGEDNAGDVKIFARCEESSCQLNMVLEDEISAKRVLSNHMFVAHKRQEQDHQQKLCGKKGGRRGGAKNKIIPIINPLSGGGGPKYDLMYPMQETNVRETEKTCKNGKKTGHEKCRSLVKEEDSEVPEEQVLVGFVQQRLLQEKLVKQSLESDVSEKTETLGNMTEMYNVVAPLPHCEEA